MMPSRTSAMMLAARSLNRIVAVPRWPSTWAVSTTPRMLFTSNRS